MEQTIKAINFSSNIKIMLQIKKDVSMLSEYDKRKLRTFYGVKNNKQLIEKVKSKGVNLFKNPETQSKRAFNYVLNEFNTAVKTEKKYNNFNKNLIKVVETKKPELIFKNLDERKKKLIVDSLSTTQNKYLIFLGSEDGERVLTLNKKTLNFLRETNLNLSDSQITDGSFSDAEIVDFIINTETIRLELVNKKDWKKGAKFFKYEHLIPELDLTDLQIYKEFNIEYYTENCFIKSLFGQVDDSILNDIRFMVKKAHTTLTSIKDIAEKHNLSIIIHGEDRITSYGVPNGSPVNICLMDDHYFKLINIPITSFALKNFKDICHLHKWNEIYKKRDDGFRRDKSRFIDSYSAVKILLENKNTHLRPIEKSILLDNTAYFKTIKDITNLSFDEDKNLRLNEYTEKENKVDYTNIFFDFETYTNGNKHVPYLCCVKSVNYKKSFFGLNCGRMMLDTLHRDFNGKPLKLIAHNISYDLKFIFKYLSRPTFIKRGSMIMFGDAYYWSNNKAQMLKFQDSYSLISSKLNKFGEMFGFKQEKEFIPYCLYTKNRETFININNKILKLCCEIQVKQNNIGKDITDIMINSFYDKFISNAKQWKCINSENELDIYKYAEIYCEIDCEILERGYNTFKTQIKDAFDMNLENYVSAAAFANDVLLKKGVYEGVYMLNGVVREFIQSCMVGGRTMCANNEKQKAEGKKIHDFDAVSLYPSAMQRLGGYLKGKPKILKSTNYNEIKNYDGYFVEVKILELNKKLSFPLLSYINDKGVRIFTNDMVGKNVYLDKTSLEDAIEFQKIKFEIIRGYYYDEGRNMKLRETISFLFNERLKLKKLENPLENIFKLIMNSAYGKTLLKPIDEEVTYIKGRQEMKKHIINNYTFHKETTLMSENDIDDKLKIYEVKKIKPINNHFNNASCGVEVLSMSKRIMNEVMCLAEDLKLKIYYQDTDSMHLEDDAIKILSENFKLKYNRDLIGKGMGQFHSDFKSKILDEKSIYARRSIFLGKKCYIDELTDKNGGIDYHIRMKGISEDSIKYHAYKDFNNDPFELFEYLSQGNEYEFDLTCNNLKCCFESVNMNTVRSKKNFTRIIKFTE
jgi:hypothetical protein